MMTMQPRKKKQTPPNKMKWKTHPRERRDARGEASRQCRGMQAGTRAYWLSLSMHSSKEIAHVAACSLWLRSLLFFPKEPLYVVHTNENSAVRVTFTPKQRSPGYFCPKTAQSGLLLPQKPRVPGSPSKRARFRERAKAASRRERRCEGAKQK